MHRTIRLAALGLAAGTVALTTPAAAVAAPAVPSASISAVAAPVVLSGNPWSPGGNTYVTVHNGGDAAAPGYFEVVLPEGTVLGATDICDAVTPGVLTKWVCGGDELPAGGEQRYLIRLNSDLLTPDFATTMAGNVAGRTADGRLGTRNEFPVTWPARTTMKLAATKGKPVAGRTTVTVKATNTGTFAIEGYSLDVNTPANATVQSSCSAEPHVPSADCEVWRAKTVQPGATDTFTVTVKVTGQKADVGFALSPVRRYTNADAKTTLTLTAK
jgi:hypothetical protein